MDDFLRLAYDRRERLRRELAAVENLIAEHERLESRTRTASSPNYELPLKTDRRVRARQSPTGLLDALFSAAERTILEAGKPLSRSELIARLEQDGFDFPGADRIKVFGTNLWRSRRFVSLKGFGYWPEAHPLPAQYKEVEQRASMLRSPKA